KYPFTHGSACRNQHRTRRQRSVGTFAARPQIADEYYRSPHDSSHLIIVGSRFQPERLRQCGLDSIARLPVAFDFDIRTRLRHPVTCRDVAAACAAGTQTRERRYFDVLTVYLQFESVTGPARTAQGESKPLRRSHGERNTGTFTVGEACVQLET